MAHAIQHDTTRLDRLLWSLGRARQEDLSARTLLLLICTAGPLYGAFMGSYAFVSAERILMVLYSALKMPLLICATTAVCLPAFFVLNTVAGLRTDFPRVLRCIFASQATFTVALAALAPVTRLVYFSGVSHRWAILTNMCAFTIATCVAQIVLWRWYRPLREAGRRHTVMLWAWVALYAFVGIQMGWMLRPFIGKPNAPVQFFRDEPFSNAYVVVARLITG